MSDSSLTFKIFGQDVSASKTLQGVGKTAEGTGGRLKSMGTIAGGAFAGIGFAALANKAKDFATETMDAFGNVGKQTMQLQRYTGGTAESMSRLAAAARGSGVDTDMLAKGLGFLSKNLDSNSAAAKGMGITYRDTQGNILPLDKLLPQISDHFAELPNGAAKTAEVLKLFGKAGMGLLPMLNKGAEGISALEAESDKLGTTLSGADIDAVKKNTVAKRQWGEAVQGLQVAIGRNLYPIITKLTNFMTTTVIPVIKKVIDWMTQHHEIVEKVALVVGVLIVSIGAFVKVMGMVKAVQEAAAVAMGVFTALTGAQTVATEEAAVAQTELDAAMDANPIGLIVLAIAALVAIIVVLWTKCEWFRNAVTVVWDAIKTAAGAVVSWFQTSVVPVLTAVWNVIVAGAKVLWSALTTYWNLVWTVVSAVVGWIAENVWPRIKVAWDSVVLGAQILWQTLTRYWQQIWADLQPIVTFIKNHVVQRFTELKDGAVAAWDIVKTNVQTAIGVVKAVIDTIKGPIDRVIGWFQGLWNAVSGAVGKVTDVLGGIQDKIFGIFKGAASWLWNVGGDIVRGLIGGIGSMAHGVMDALLGLIPDPLKKFAGALGINSPSTVFAEFGAALPAGFAQGIDSGSDAVARSISSMASIAGTPQIGGPSMRSGGGNIVNITVNGAVDPASTVQQIRGLMLNYKRTTGVELGVG